MQEMETKIRSLEIRINVLLVLGTLSFLVSLAKLLPILAPQHVPSNLNSVQIGNASKEKPQREFLNSDEVGEREGVSSRTVTSWIEQGRIYPQPTRQGRAWTIAADYRLLPITAELTETKP
jgi:hypothetical protein